MLRLVRNDLYKLILSFWNLFLFFIFLMCMLYYTVNISFIGVEFWNPGNSLEIRIENTTEYVNSILSICVWFTPIFNAISLSRDVASQLLNNVGMLDLKRSVIYYSRLLSSVILYLITFVICFAVTFIVGKCIGVEFSFDYGITIKLILTYSFIEIAVLSIYLMLLFWTRNLFWSCGIALAGFGVFENVKDRYGSYLFHKAIESCDITFDPSATFFDDNYWKWIIGACLVAVISSIIGEKVFSKKDL